MLLGATGATRAQAPPGTAAPSMSFAAQGWSAADRETFYTTGQGSHLIPFAWFKALQQRDSNQPFMADQLARYGYLRSDSPNDLPVGFVVEAKTEQLGMTCAACHTNELEYQKDSKTYAMRLDGAPALADFQQFLLDLTAATRATVSDAGRFDTFAKAVLGGGYTPAKAAQLKTDFGAWVKQFGDFMDASLPASPWGPGRLDAFGMIFNRVAARDLGLEHGPHDNFRVADAPVSYPFLWNASRQDHTQWNGGVANGLFIQGLARNTGEVYGVFADFKPRIKVPQTSLTPTIIDFKTNSADFAGLQTLEEKIATLQPPPWPRDVWPINDDLAKKGAGLFKLCCAECHAERPSSAVPQAWSTPVRAVGTDPKMATNAARTSEPGIYLGALRPPPALLARFTDPASTAEMLGTSVIGSLLDEAFSPPITPKKIKQSGVWRAIQKDLDELLPDEKLDDAAKIKALAEIKARLPSRLANMFVKPRTADAGASYESRVLHGIWATAPYLHNGSVPNLWELLLPPGRRSTTFKVGSRKFDPKNVGYATDETPFKSGTFVVDPQNLNGNGNGGHDYTSNLSDDDRWAIVEYLKTQ
jgi:mono/diheme cytochrome c family protein